MKRQGQFDYSSSSDDFSNRSTTKSSHPNPPPKPKSKPKSKSKPKPKSIVEPLSSGYPQHVYVTALGMCFHRQGCAILGDCFVSRRSTALCSRKACSRAAFALIPFLLPTRLARKDPTFLQRRRNGVRPTKALHPKERRNRNPRRKKRRLLAPNACALLRVENTSTVKGAAFWWAETFLAALPTLCSRKAFCRASIALVDY